MSATQHGAASMAHAGALPLLLSVLPLRQRGGSAPPRVPRRASAPHAAGVTVRRARLCTAAAAAQSDGLPRSQEAASANFIDMFNRASTPMGTFQRAEAALAAARAMAADRSSPQAELQAGLPQRPARVRDAGARAPTAWDMDTATLDSVLGVPASPPRRGGAVTSSPGGGGGGGGGGGSSAGAASPAARAPGPDFWSWAPPETGAHPPQRAPPAPALQRAKAPAPARAAEVMDRPSDVSLPPLQSQADLPSWQEALLQRMAAPSVAATAASSIDAQQSTSVSAAAQSEAAAALAAAAEALSLTAESGAASGVRADGSRWWRETGTQELQDGRLCVWTVLRGCSADGATEWQDKWWRTSDAWGYRELGAEKSGRCCDGSAWRECWHEAYDTRSPVERITRHADKWATDAAGAQWHEIWSEAFGSDGAVERTAHKSGSVGRGVIPEDGHAGEWTEKWGETWDGRGFARKWADRWASRAEREGGGQPRRWGEHWTQEFQASRQGARWGEAWSDDPGGGGWYSRKWGEDHHGNGVVRKWGSATDGQNWDVQSQEDSWYEGASNFGWHDALRHSPQLLTVALRPRTQGQGDTPPGVLGKPGKRRGGEGGGGQQQ